MNLVPVVGVFSTAEANVEFSPGEDEAAAGPFLLLAAAPLSGVACLLTPYIMARLSSSSAALATVSLLSTRELGSNSIDLKVCPQMAQKDS